MVHQSNTCWWLSRKAGLRRRATAGSTTQTWSVWGAQPRTRRWDTNCSTTTRWRPGSACTESPTGGQTTAAPASDPGGRTNPITNPMMETTLGCASQCTTRFGWTGAVRLRSASSAKVRSKMTHIFRLLSGSKERKTNISIEWMIRAIDESQTSKKTFFPLSCVKF